LRLTYFCSALRAVWTVAAPYLLIALFLKPLKTTALEALFVALVILYPLVWLLSFALNRVRSREGRIRLEEEAVLATEDAHADREREAQRQQARIESRPPVDGAEAA
jgi:CBS domain containing-hemolysin-like protein